MKTATRGTRPQSALDRMLPHDLDAERAVIGSMLLDETAIDEAVNVLAGCGRDAFWNERLGTMFALCAEMRETGKPIDGIVIKNELERRGLFESLGGYGFLDECISSVPSHVRVREYAAIVRAKYVLRQVIRSASVMMDSAFEDRERPADIVASASREIDRANELIADGRVNTTWETQLETVYAGIESPPDDRPSRGVCSGLIQLDDLLCGFQPGELAIVAARPSMGKTSLGLRIIEGACLFENVPSLVFSIEMTSAQLVLRLLCMRGQVDSQRVRHRRIGADELLRLKNARDDWDRRPIHVHDGSATTIEEIAAVSRLQKRRMGIGLIMVDYLTLVRVGGEFDSNALRVGEIARRLKVIAKDLQVPVICMAQLNRDPEKTNSRPMLKDLRDSGEIEQHADSVIFVWQDRTQPHMVADRTTIQNGKATLIVAKQRNGPCGEMDIDWRGEFTRFDNPSIETPQMF